MKRVTTILLLTILLALPVCAFAEGGKGRLAYRGFSGGMMLHTGWVSAGSVTVGLSQPQRMSGLPMGIGGALKVRFGDHLRVGTEGYTSALGYGDWGSSLSIGWGGLLVDWCWQMGRFMPYVGATVGGGLVENLTLTSKPQMDFLPEANISYRKYGVGLIVPFAGVEYGITERMSLTLKGDYMFSLSPNASDFPSGVRCYVGFMFNH